MLLLLGHHYQGLFFPLAYLGFLEALALLVMSVVLAFAVVLTNMTCDFATCKGPLSRTRLLCVLSPCCYCCCCGVQRRA